MPNRFMGGKAPRKNDGPGVLTRHRGLWVRPETTDAYTVDEARGYRRMDIRPGDTVLDVGAHIGAFTATALSMGAGRVVAYEPEPDNYEIFLKNTAYLTNDQEVMREWGIKSGQVWSMPKAITGDGRRLDLYVNDGRGTTRHTYRPTRGRKVVSVQSDSWREVLDEFEPNAIKVDIEGGEYDLDFSLLCAPHVRSVAVEFHELEQPHRLVRAATIINCLIADGFTAVKRPNLDALSAATLGIFNRLGG